ncbi:MAG TPA: formate dehydrogenase accessory sulfurtransferase FdhD [Actinobacteria bacterium]|nr:formate dehydrogenase accessory sulfurtransferase FdhD [Actinomycetota bacterium]
MSDPIRDVEVTRVTGTRTEPGSDPVVVEAPIEIRLGTTPVAVLMRTPGEDEDLVRGFALTEGIVLRPDELVAVDAVGDDRYRLVLRDDVAVDPERFRRNLSATSSCGVCGKASIDAVRIATPPIDGDVVVPRDVVAGLARRMRRHQPVFDRTGGLHAAALFGLDGTLHVVREDIGRHNAVDKAIGRRATVRWRLLDEILLVSGRVSFEIVQKAGVAGVRVVAGISAPSSLAIDLARELGIVLVAFLRDDGFSVYSGANRLG